MFGVPEDSDNNTGIEVIVDRLSKIAHLAAVPNTIDSEVTAQLFLDRVFRQQGLPVPIFCGVEKSKLSIQAVVGGNGVGDLAEAKWRSVKWRSVNWRSKNPRYSAKF